MVSVYIILYLFKSYTLICCVYTDNWNDILKHHGYHNINREEFRQEIEHKYKRKCSHKELNYRLSIGFDICFKCVQSNVNKTNKKCSFQNWFDYGYYVNDINYKKNDYLNKIENDLSISDEVKDNINEKQMIKNQHSFSRMNNNSYNTSFSNNVIILALMTYKNQSTTKFTDKCDELYFKSIGYVDKYYPKNHFVHFIIINEKISISEYMDNLNLIHCSHPILSWIRSKSLKKDNYMAYKIIQHGAIQPYHQINNKYYKNRQGLIKLKQQDINIMFKDKHHINHIIKNGNIQFKMFGLVVDFKMISLIADNKKNVEFRKSNFISIY